ncbi:MAG: YbaB/EbfC family nucleoid-associated protein [Phycisphaerales bacterium]|nr:YbaB/EbfC family nucleoid-associated protein [Phycisphaerales bacterium]
MFEQMKAMGAIAGLLKNKERIRETAAKVKERLAATEVTGAAGGGAVKVTISGSLRVTRVEIDRSVASGMGASDDARARAEALLAEAANDALERVQKVIRDEAAREARELGLPDLPGLDKLF